MTVPTQIATSQKVRSQFWIATLLVSGTCIGGGMLALPIQTAKSGFLQTIAGIATSWFFMTFTGLLLIEATLWIKNETHFTSLSRILIGNKTRILTMCVYLFMNYASLIAYTAAGAQLFSQWCYIFLGIQVSYVTACFLFTLVFGSVLWFGAIVVGKFNFIFMLGLIGAYICLVLFGIPRVNRENLLYFPPIFESFGIFSMILATFSYQMIVPSFCKELNYDGPLLRKALITGTSIPLIIYSIWILVIHGVVPLSGENGLLAAYEMGSSATGPLRAHLDHVSLPFIADFFGLFAVVTSYFGLSLALFHFLKDCFAEISIALSKKMIILCSLLPTLFLAMLFPKALLQFLDLSGAYGDTILSGLIPIGMVWVGRYKKGLQSDFRTPGGKGALVFAALFYLSVIAMEWL